MLRVRSQSSDYGLKIGVIITDENFDGKRMVAKPLEFEDYSKKIVEVPTIEIPIFHEGAKEPFAAFFRDWVELGKKLQISMGEDFTKERVAMKAHLDDMSKIAYTLLDYKTRNK